ncbi:OpgC domain-containing protein [Bradyrhizobium sp. WSM2793]|uniref:OpgC domain-containing protein n=1 Tax=Bradyrhizobium sp. WSM2793 TaxID=1038866 RepID=UPI000369E193|nr:OpgC domain-containing protein [Bradyrhizobium sp. WSM2793]
MEKSPDHGRKHRDLRLDVFRGLANWLIFLGHVPESLLAWFTTRNYGFSDGADLFVFISGYTATLVYSRMMTERGFVVGATRLWKRAWQLYVAQLLLFLFYTAAIHYVAHRWDIVHLMDQFNVAGLMDDPVDTLVQAMTLRYKPLNLDVLPLYIVLMLFFPFALWLLLRWPDLTMLASVALYLAARQFGWNLTSYPSGHWYFDPFTWQLLFLLGGWMVLRSGEGIQRVASSRWAIILSVIFVVFAFLVTVSASAPALQALVPPGLRSPFVPNDKTYLAPYRIVHLVALLVLAVNLIPRDCEALSGPLLRSLVKCGQQSLEVFCVGIFLSFVAHLVLITTSGGLIVELLVGMSGIATMVGVAYYRSWSKEIDRPRLSRDGSAGAEQGTSSRT